MAERLKSAVAGLSALLVWALGVVAAVLPSAVARAGMRPRAGLWQAEGGRLEPAGVLHRSWLGVETVDPDGDPARYARRIVLTAKGEIYRTRERVSGAAYAGGRKAMALRLSDLSPIPPEAARFDYRRVSTPGADPIEVEIVLARETRITALAELAPGSLIAAPDDHGRPAFIFDKGGAGRSGALIAGFALVLALGLAGLSAAGWFERGSEALAGEQAQLLAEGRSLRESTQLRAMAEPALAREAEAVRLGRLAATLEMLGETGKGGPLARLTLNGEALDLIPAGSGAAEQVALAAPDTGEAERGTGLDEPRAAGTQ